MEAPSTSTTTDGGEDALSDMAKTLYQLLPTDGQSLRSVILDKASWWCHEQDIRLWDWEDGWMAEQFHRKVLCGLLSSYQQDVPLCFWVIYRPNTTSPVTVQTLQLLKHIFEKTQIHPGSIFELPYVCSSGAGKNAEHEQPSNTTDADEQQVAAMAMAVTSKLRECCAYKCKMPMVACRIGVDGSLQLPTRITSTVIPEHYQQVGEISDLSKHLIYLILFMARHCISQTVRCGKIVGEHFQWSSSIQSLLQPEEQPQKGH